MPRLRLKDYLVIAGGILLIAVFTLALVASPAAAQTAANGPYYATPSWDQTLPSATRFIVLSNFASAAVLDRETGLVWEKSPNTNTSNWFIARSLCTAKTVGGRKGWRLPTVDELASLIDPSVPFPGISLPAGHPFTNIEPTAYWSATQDATDSTLAWVVQFQGGGVIPDFKTTDNLEPAWCVRGDSHAIVY